MIFSLKGRSRKHSDMLYDIKNFDNRDSAIFWRDQFIAGTVEAPNLYPTHYTGDRLELYQDTHRDYAGMLIAVIEAR